MTVIWPKQFSVYRKRSNSNSPLSGRHLIGHLHFIKDSLHAKLKIRVSTTYSRRPSVLSTCWEIQKRICWASLHRFAGAKNENTKNANGKWKSSVFDEKRRVNWKYWFVSHHTDTHTHTRNMGMDGMSRIRMHRGIACRQLKLFTNSFPTSNGNARLVRQRKSFRA